jgi:hypothetical protein
MVRSISIAYKEVVNLRAHSQTIDQRPQIGVSVSPLDWLHRVSQWFKGLTLRSRPIPSVSPYGTWEPEHERFQPLRADAALDIVISQRGMSWATQLYNSSL